ncbi:pantetheine-phosphate adenylyltransferase [Bowdeniella nasicola]|uniref:Phosphopantetheine adenylyltransferase n=1 Tax=Bowdeniella nasicola TaxID=208480 RepID=A0A1Q5Q4B8_9ACTO|nr:pantetheine-phosphate adenylyltransferase [Bowdeniella nasicola]OKL54657.1 pantetheine-phosphate adenylyltransferase [Bowdeniella nasicola]
MTTSIAVLPGSYDPMTLGHVDVIKRARSMFDRVIVAVAYNASKNSLFDLDTRVELARASTQEIENVEVKPVPGLLADFCREEGATAIVKGLRGSADFDAELAMSLMNRELCDIETVFIMGAPGLNHIASSIVKDVARHGGDVSEFVDPAVARALSGAFSRRG